MQRQQHPMGYPYLLRYRPGLAASQQAAGGAVWPRIGLSKPRDGPVNGTVKVFHKQDDHWCRSRGDVGGNMLVWLCR